MSDIEYGPPRYRSRPQTTDRKCKYRTANEPSGTQGCNDNHPALARIVRRHWRQQLPAADTERGAPRSESKISMIASGNHTIILTQWCNEYHPAQARIVSGDSPH